MPNQNAATISAPNAQSSSEYEAKILAEIQNILENEAKRKQRLSMSKSQKMAELAYFWGLAGTLQGLLTPNIHQGFPSPVYISFFWNHGFVVISALFLPLAMGWHR